MPETLRSVKRELIIWIFGEEADYGIDADVDAGSLIVNGKNKKNHYKANSDKDKKIEINASAGEVNISFK